MAIGSLVAAAWMLLPAGLSSGASTAALDCGAGLAGLACSNVGGAYGTVCSEGGTVVDEGPVVELPGVGLIVEPNVKCPSDPPV